MQKLQDFLTQQNMTQTQLAKELGFGTGYVSMILSGQRRVTDAFRWRFAQVYGTDTALSIVGNGHDHDHAATSIAPQGGFVDTP